MASKKLYIVNQRMLKWMQYAVETGKADNQKDWCDQIGFPFTNISQIKNGLQGFTLGQIEKASKLINGNMNWLWNLETNVLRKSKQHTAIELLRQATTVIETELGLNGLARKGARVNKIVNTKNPKETSKEITLFKKYKPLQERVSEIKSGVMSLLMLGPWVRVPAGSQG
jgi:hypothetical protein